AFHGQHHVGVGGGVELLALVRRIPERVDVAASPAVHAVGAGGAVEVAGAGQRQPADGAGEGVPVAREVSADDVIVVPPATGVDVVVGGELAVVVRSVRQQADAQLAQVAQALGGAGAVSGCAQGRQQDTDQQTNNR